MILTRNMIVYFSCYFDIDQGGALCKRKPIPGNRFGVRSEKGCEKSYRKLEQMLNFAINCQIASVR